MNYDVIEVFEHDNHGLKVEVLSPSEKSSKEKMKVVVECDGMDTMNLQEFKSTIKWLQQTAKIIELTFNSKGQKIANGEGKDD